MADELEFWGAAHCVELVNNLRNHDTSKPENPLFLYSFHLLHTPLQALASPMFVFEHGHSVSLQVPKAWLEKLDALVSAAGGKPIDSENRLLGPSRRIVCLWNP